MVFELFHRLLLENGANVVALNNDCSIPLDICKSEEIKELFKQDINSKGNNIFLTLNVFK